MWPEIYIHGAGTNGQHAAKVCADHGISVLAFLDNFTEKTEFCGLPVLRPHQADLSVPVVVTSPHYAMEITLQLEYMGFQTTNLSRFYSSMGLEPAWGHDRLVHRVEHDNLRDSLADRRSKYVFDAVMKFRATLDPLYPAAVCSPMEEQWFAPDLFTPGPHVFVDGGAYDGDTAEAFIKRCPDYHSIHCFEPSSSLAAKARERMAGKRDVKVYQAGLDGIHGGGLLQHAGTPSGKKGGSGEAALFTRLDDIDMERPTFIKLDVEGCELGALQGARGIITEGRPFLAVAVYHKPEDIWTIPQLLSTMQDYKFYLRHYTQFYHETVLYAI